MPYTRRMIQASVPSSQDGSKSRSDELVNRIRDIAHVAYSLQTIEHVPEFENMMNYFYHMAPTVARAMAVAIQKNIADDSIEPMSDVHNLRKRRHGHSQEHDEARPLKTARIENIAFKTRKGAPEGAIECQIKLSRDESNEPVSGSEQPGFRALDAEKPGEGTQESLVIEDEIEKGEIRCDQASQLGVSLSEVPAAGAEVVRMPRETVSTQLKTVRKTSRSTDAGSKQSVTKITPLRELIHQAVRTIHGLANCPSDPPRDAYSGVLQMLQVGRSQATSVFHSSSWSDGTTWIYMLMITTSQRKQATILNMLGYIGASEWFDRQCDSVIAEEKVHTKKNKPVQRKGAASFVLDNICRSSSDMKTIKKKYLVNQFTRGANLRKLVEGIGLGILFDPRIWDYAKRQDNTSIVEEVQADRQRKGLLQTLGLQVEKLVQNGYPDLHEFYMALEKERVISQHEIQKLREEFISESDPVCKNVLNNAVDSLIALVSRKVFDKKPLADDDLISISGSVGIPCSIFQRLRPDSWLDSWLIMAAMRISDRPFWVQYSESIPLDCIGMDNESHPISRPFKGWSNSIKERRQKARDTLGDEISLVYFCPVNHRNNHFTLLEISDRKRTIRHYDSLVDKRIQNGKSKTKSRIARLVEEEFGDLEYDYEEAPTPQQADGWSCGIRVVWNFRRLSMGLPIGSWMTKQSPERMKMEIVESLSKCVEANGIVKHKALKSIHKSHQGYSMEL